MCFVANNILLMHNIVTIISGKKWQSDLNKKTNLVME